jgi:hypothetical protein
MTQWLLLHLLHSYRTTDIRHCLFLWRSVDVSFPLLHRRCCHSYTARGRSYWWCGALKADRHRINGTVPMANFQLHMLLSWSCEMRVLRPSTICKCTTYIYATCVILFGFSSQCVNALLHLSPRFSQIIRGAPKSPNKDVENINVYMFGAYWTELFPCWYKLFPKRNIVQRCYFISFLCFSRLITCGV